MTRSEIFTAAHALAKLNRFIYGTDVAYRDLFAAALREVYAYGQDVVEGEGQRAWMASVTGLCARYGFARTFVNHHGRRGSKRTPIKRWRAAELDGLYQLGDNYGREWWLVAGGVAIEIKIDEMHLRGLWPAPRAAAA